ncbi:hypothetical protein [Sediminicurvatus halobius]|uniref:DUF995 domain-containing protein n=1 Tax=Sediminicurvatus halobius TaxID=2182432 RepID=A0A2U2MZW7_9GAMM|nr:hypothetical protein [Spiribacter halobius]PWG62348.1 hypothetical protein DEM34_12810 [Spiribacter halobius]UEX79729.1 hypothetical protein LMH63_08810 [Spiribacter halobius]
MHPSRNTLRLAAASTAILIAAGCATAPSPTELQEAGRGPLDREQLEALHEDGLHLSWSNAQGSGTATYYPDGTLEAAWDGGGTAGTWRIADDGRFCRSLEVEDNEEKCFRIYEGETDNTYLSYRNGEQTTSWEVLETTASR